MTEEPEYKLITRSTYDRIAGDYSDRDQKIKDGEAHLFKSVLDRFVVGLPSGARVLDVGFGGGRDCRYFQIHGLKPVGVDNSAEMVRWARHQDPAGEYRLMDLEGLDFPPASFDAVWANASLHHLPKERLPAVLVQLERVLRPGGSIHIIVKRGHRQGFKAQVKFGQRIQRYFACYEPAELAQLMQSAGFGAVRTGILVPGRWVRVWAQKPPLRISSK